MGDRTGISWTGKTWNPWHGCRKVSRGCAHCYMYREKAAYGQDPTAVVRSKTTFRDPLRWREPARVFTCSWSDFFIEEADAWRDEAWAIIRETPHLTYQILTKRPERIGGRLPWGPDEAPWPHVWLGISAEDQRALDARIFDLIRAEAAVRFLSLEPLLGPISLEDYVMTRADQASGVLVNAIDWIILGGESGPGHRQMEVAWLEALVRQGREAGVPVFVKQDAGPRPGRQGRIPDAYWVREMPR